MKNEFCTIFNVNALRKQMSVQNLWPICQFASWEDDAFCVSKLYRNVDNASSRDKC